MKKTIIAKDNKDLNKLIQSEMNLNGNNCNLNHIDVSNVTDFSSLFYCSFFNGDISQWNTSNATNMEQMFAYSQFNGDISTWNTSNVINMKNMFFRSKFNQNLSQWNTSNVAHMSYMFSCSQFNQEISQWNISNVTDMNFMFDEFNPNNPWWFIEDNQLRKNAIEKFNLTKELNNDLPDNSNYIKKMKV